MMTRMGRRTDAIAGVVLAALGACIFVQALRWEVVGADGPGPGFFPLGYGIAIFCLSLALCVASFRRRNQAQAVEMTDAAGAMRDHGGLWIALFAWLVFAATIALMPLLGFPIGLALLTFVLVSLIFNKPLTTAALTAVMLGLGFYLVFPIALGVDLPVGRLGI